jgi:glycosyltransferase involved in cell wall biosynthesis
LEHLAPTNNDIIFTGWLEPNGPELIALYNKAKIFALTSQRESQGIVYIEAMSAGCAILGSDCGAIKETVSSDVGLLANPTDPADIKDKLATMISSPELLDRFSERSKMRYQNNYLWDKIIAEYLELTRSI